MQVVHDCPGCGGTIRIDAWHFARAALYACPHCDARIRPPEEMRRATVNLINARRRADEEFRANASPDSTVRPASGYRATLHFAVTGD